MLSTRVGEVCLGQLVCFDEERPCAGTQSKSDDGVLHGVWNDFSDSKLVLDELPHAPP